MVGKRRRSKEFNYFRQKKCKNCSVNVSTTKPYYIFCALEKTEKLDYHLRYYYCSQDIYRYSTTLWDEGQKLNVFVRRIQKPDFSM